jgi:hypothetical protein
VTLALVSKVDATRFGGGCSPVICPPNLLPDQLTSLPVHRHESRSRLGRPACTESPESCSWRSARRTDHFHLVSTSSPCPWASLSDRGQGGTRLKRDRKSDVGLTISTDGVREIAFTFDSTSQEQEAARPPPISTPLTPDASLAFLPAAPSPRGGPAQPLPRGSDLGSVNRLCSPRPVSTVMSANTTCLGAMGSLSSKCLSLCRNLAPCEMSNLDRKSTCATRAMLTAGCS